MVLGLNVIKKLEERTLKFNEDIRQLRKIYLKEVIIAESKEDEETKYLIFKLMYQVYKEFFLSYSINFMNFCVNEDKLSKIDSYIKNKLKDI